MIAVANVTSRLLLFFSSTQFIVQVSSSFSHSIILNLILTDLILFTLTLSHCGHTTTDPLAAMIIAGDFDFWKTYTLATIFKQDVASLQNVDTLPEEIRSSYDPLNIPADRGPCLFIVGKSAIESPNNQVVILSTITTHDI
jgi:hypothetical protein